MSHPAARRARVLGAVLALSLLLLGCGDDAARGAATTSPTAPDVVDPVRGTITVSAAASLSDVFDEIVSRFGAANPQAEVLFNFGSSGQLARQVTEGAPADVVAFADTTPMDLLSDADLLAEPARVFATNTLVIVTPPGNPAGVDGLASLARAGTVSLCVDTAPCGKFADELLSLAGVGLAEAQVHRGRDVRDTLAAVTNGDADAAIVYVSDAMAAGDRVRVVEVPEAAGIVATYPVAPLAGSPEPALAAAFVEFVLSDDARQLLRDAGFGPP